eukprot:CAMPEP_0113886698 /NCGR_PEP_ID=MMETSP0780_2-20120614/11718_1 /TAXON_ID=652834 /ORGANISM="Palpitomonas bilix" /LENGTH=63 /DNA_ID=CAMNT_0000874979 /DNA_START=12 /DNA_END=199 /DNA_ORIENTATION=+ /assembly_acc=CAM_ASM_000599
MGALDKINIEQIVLPSEEPSPEAQEIDKALVSVPLFPDIEKIVPLLALQEVSSGTLDDESGLV